MSHKKTFFGASSLAVAVVLVLGITGYNYQHSPRAQAEELVNHGLFQITQISPDQFGTIQEKFGSDPRDALKEAKEAKDLRVITKEEFDAESKNASGVFSASLNSDPTAPSTVSIMGHGEGGMSTQSGAVRMSANAATTSAGPPPTFSTVTLPAPAEAGAATGSTIVVRGEASPVNAESTGIATVNSGTISSSGGNATISSGTTSFSTATPVGKIQPLSADGKPGVMATPAEFKVVMPTSYLQYTNTKGQTVVLSLDKDGLPMFKTIFLSSSDMPSKP